MSSLGNRIDVNSAFITGDDPGALALTGQKMSSVFVPSCGGPRIGKPFNEIGTSRYTVVVTGTPQHEALACSNPPPQYLAPIPATVQEEPFRVRQTPLSFEVSNEIAQSGALLQGGGIAESTVFGSAPCAQQRNADEPQATLMIDTNSFLSDPAPEEKVHPAAPTQLEVHRAVQPAPANPLRPTYAKEPTKKRRKGKRPHGIKRSSKRRGTRKGARWSKQHSQRWYVSLGKRPNERIKYKCTVCDGVTAHPRNHFATHHEHNDPEVAQAAAAFRYACNQCKSTFAQKPALTKHTRKCHRAYAVPPINVGTSSAPSYGFGGVSPGSAAIRDVPLSHFTESVSSGSPMLSPALSSVSAASVPPLISPSASTRSMSPATLPPNAVQLVQTNSFASGDQVMEIEPMDIGDTSPMSTMSFDNATCPLP